MIDENLAKKDRRYHEGFFKRNWHGLMVWLLKGVSRLPFGAIYALSDCMYFIVRYVVRYRKRVITENLKAAFPEKSEKQINKIRNEYYRHFCDFALETVKLHTISHDEMDRRLEVTGLEPTRKYAEQGKSIILLGVHYNNWEWCSSIQRKAFHKLLMIVNPMRGNMALDRFIAHSRERWGGISVPVHKSARVSMEYVRRGEPSVLWLAADQTPPAHSKFWTYFLNREAPFFSGPEKIAIKTNQPVFFLHLRKLRRGYYRAEFSLLVENPQLVEGKDILLAYIRKMEEMIREEPQYYLWSHRRWKHKRPEGVELTL